MRVVRTTGLPAPPPVVYVIDLDQEEVEAMIELFYRRARASHPLTRAVLDNLADLAGVRPSNHHYHHGKSGIVGE
jgi:predicted transposase YdaD